MTNGMGVKPVDLSRVDLNLLTVLAALMRERHVSRAAERLNLGQPAVSHALARLRALTDDPLLVRKGSVMEPTPRALALMDAVGPALETVEACLRSLSRFDPASDTRVFRIGIADELQWSVLPPLSERLRRQAPLTRLVVAAVSHRDAMVRLEEATVDTVLGYVNRLPASAKQRRVGTVRYSVLRSDVNRPALDIDEYCRRPHVLVTFAADLQGVIDDLLASVGRQREVVLSVPQFGLVPSLLTATDRLATVPDTVARALAAAGPLRMDALPFQGPEFPITLAWRAAADTDPGQQWFRTQVLQAMGDCGLGTSRH